MEPNINTVEISVNSEQEISCENDLSIDEPITNESDSDDTDLILKLAPSGYSGKWE